MLSRALWISWAMWGLATAIGVVRFREGQHHALIVFEFAVCGQIGVFLFALRPIIQILRAISPQNETSWQADRLAPLLATYLAAVSSSLTTWMILI